MFLWTPTYQTTICLHLENIWIPEWPDFHGLKTILVGKKGRKVISLRV